MKNVFLFSVLISLIMFCSCESDDSKNLNTFSVDADCVLISDPIENTDDECDMKLNPEATCPGLSELDLVVILTDEQKRWFPWFCLDKDQKIYYSDENGNEIYLQVESVIHDYSPKLFRLNGYCEFNTVSSACLDRERILISLVSNGFDNRINLLMEKNLFSTDDSSEHYDNTEFWIYRSSFSGLGGKIIDNTMMLAEIERVGTLETCCPLLFPTTGGVADTLYRNAFHEEITLNDRMFKEVISSDAGDWMLANSMYSSIHGLVAFTDDQGTLWIQN